MVLQIQDRVDPPERVIKPRRKPKFSEEESYYSEVPPRRSKVKSAKPVLEPLPPPVPPPQPEPPKEEQPMVHYNTETGQATLKIKAMNTEFEVPLGPKKEKEVVQQPPVQIQLPQPQP